MGVSKLSHAGLVSVVIPCYNYGAFIADTIRSLVAQSYENWEAIVVDDGSTDDTQSRVAVLMQEDTRVSYVYQQNQGVSVARNTGMAHARGEFLLFLDADDLLTSSKLRSHVEHFRRFPDLDISYSKFRYFSDAKRNEFFTNYDLDSLKEKRRIFSGCGKDTFPIFIRKNPLPIQASIFRRAMLQRVGYFKPDMRALEDWDFLLRSILRGALIAPLDSADALALIRVHSGSATRNVSFSNYMESVYGNVQGEIDRMRSLGDVEAADFYAHHLSEALSDIARRRARRGKKIRRLEIMDSIRAVGVFDFFGLYTVLKKWRFEFFGAYCRVLAEKISLFFGECF